jgi:hypothetical protein
MAKDFKSNRTIKKHIITAMEKVDKRQEKRLLNEKPFYIEQTIIRAIRYLREKYSEIPHTRISEFDFRIELNKNVDDPEYKVSFRIGSGSKGKRFSKYIGQVPFVIPVLNRMGVEQVSNGEVLFTPHALEDIKRLTEKNLGSVPTQPEK